MNRSKITGNPLYASKVLCTHIMHTEHCKLTMTIEVIMDVMYSTHGAKDKDNLKYFKKTIIITSTDTNKPQFR